MSCWTRAVQIKSHSQAAWKMKEKPLLPPLPFPVTSVRHEHASVSCLYHMPHTKSRLSVLREPLTQPQWGTMESSLVCYKPAGWSQNRADTRTVLVAVHGLDDTYSYSHSNSGWLTGGGAAHTSYTRPCCARPTHETSNAARAFIGPGLGGGSAPWRTTWPALDIVVTKTCNKPTVEGVLMTTTSWCFHAGGGTYEFKTK